MTPEEMQALSRKAAGKLPFVLGIGPFAYAPTLSSGPLPEGEQWLHESTEACAEIMVQVLWRRGISIGGSSNGFAMAWGTYPPLVETLGNDPMQAFRIAVLRAVCEREK